MGKVGIFRTFDQTHMNGTDSRSLSQAI